jgi:hypothetical protein
MRLAGFLSLAALALAGCGGPAEPVWAPEAEVQRFAYSNGDPPSLTLFTVVNKDLEAGRHSGLMINGRERIMFDPAGSFRLPQAPERNDVIHGMNDRVLAVYIDYHARETFDVHIQEVEVTPEVAEMVAQAVKAYGAVPKAQCSLSITRILSKTPGFETIPVGYSPTRTMNAFGRIPGVTTRIVTDDDADDNHGVLFEAAQRPVPTVSDR